MRNHIGSGKKPLTKAQIIEQMGIAYGVFASENKDMAFSFPVLILLGDSYRTGKVKEYCEAWLHIPATHCISFKMLPIFLMVIIPSKSTLR